MVRKKDPLSIYRKRRNFTHSPEPKGNARKKRAKRPIFVIQKHAARSLHYDFRLEIDGLLKSWAVPKGPSLNPKDKRLAVPTDDHPLEYAKFEGIIPAGLYGAGAVIVWDKGTYRNIKKEDGKLVPMEKCFKKGIIEVFLHGKKLKGRYALIRTNKSAIKQWLLIKMRDEYADARRKPTSSQSESVLSGRTIKELEKERTVTTKNKLLFPTAGITKGDLIHYYERIAPIIIPHIKNRPLTMHRFVHGITGEGFYQKDAPDYFPSWITVAPIEKKEGGIVRYVLCNDVATLVYIINQLCITPHVWLSRIPKLEYPDRMIFDLDPSKGINFTAIRWAAKKIKELLEKLGLVSFIMTTGSRGFHVAVPLKEIHTFDYTRTFAHDLALLLVHRYPGKLTIEMRKKKRGRRLFIDILCNAFAQTTVVPYGVRAKPGAPIATPIEWNELFSKGIKPQSYTIKNIFRRLGRKKDPWLTIDSYAVSLKQARKKLDMLLREEGLLGSVDFSKIVR